MITILRKHHRWLMIVIAILAIPFVFYFNKSDLGATRVTDIGRIYDRPVTQVEFTRQARLMNLANSLGLTLGNDLMTANVSTEGEMYVEFTWNRLTFHHEAERLGIHPSSSEITAFVKTMPRFRGAAGFDINKYTEFTKGMLPSLGFTETQIEEVVSDQLSLNRVKELLGTSVQVPETESQENYERAYGKMEAAVVRLRDEDFQKDLTITDDDIAKYYEAHKAQLKSEEKRRVEFVAFAMTGDEKKLTGKERVEALQKLADRANDFSQALLEKDAKFAEIAGKSQTPVDTTGEFTTAAPDPKLAGNPQATQYAFQLTQEAPFSDPIQGPDGFLILHLLARTEARLLSLEEAKPKITDTLKAERLRDLVSKKGAEVANKIREALKSGTPLENIAQQGGFKLERIPAFSLVETPAPKPEASKDATSKDPTPAPKEAKSKPKDAKPAEVKAADAKPKDEKPADVKAADAKPKDEPPDLPAIKNAVAALNPGEVSEFVPAEKGGLVVVLEKRAPADPSGYAAAKAQFESRYLMQRRGAIFVEWLRDRRRAAGVSVATG